MKTYFAKYLPIEEEIKKGDIEIDGYYYSSTEGILKCNNDSVFKDNLDRAYKLGFRKVKLFLCSRDIREGDEFIIPEDYIVDPDLYLNDKATCTSISEDGEVVHYSCPCRFGGETHSGVFLCGNPYKIIGEVSIEASWVKEGDEFDLQEIVPWHKDKLVGSGFKLMDFGEAKTDKSKEWTTFYKIKCPICKTFH